MTWYYAREGQHAGPFSEEQFRELIANGAIQANTLVWEARLPNWVPLSQVPPDVLPPASTSAAPGSAPPFVAPTPRCANCGGAFPAENLVPIEGVLICPNCKPVVLNRIKEGAAPLHTATDPDEIVRNIVDQGREIEVGRCVSTAWEVMKANFGPMVGVPLLVFLVMGAGGMVPFVGSCISIVVTGPLMGGLYLYLLKQIRGQGATIGDAFSGFSRNFAQLMLASIVTSILAYLPLLPFGVYFFARNIGRGGPDFGMLDGVLLAIGFVALMYLALAWMFTVPLVADKGMRFWPAMQVSRRVVNHRFGPFLLLILVSIAISLAGVLALCVGLFIAMPLVFTIYACAYEQLFGASESFKTAAVSHA